MTHCTKMLETNMRATIIINFLQSNWVWVTIEVRIDTLTVSDHFLYKTISFWWSIVFIHQSSQCRLQTSANHISAEAQCFSSWFLLSTRFQCEQIGMLGWSNGETGKHSTSPLIIDPSAIAGPLRIIGQRLVQCQHLP